MKISSEYLKIGKDRIAVKLIKQPKYINQEKIIVMLHEGLGSIEMWKDWPLKLAKKTKMNLILYSRIGMGCSSREKIKKQSDFLEKEALYYLPKVIENYCSSIPILLGHSDGASISLIYAGNNFPCKGLILEAPHVFVEEITLNEIKKLKKIWKDKTIKEKFKKYHKNPENAFKSWCDVWLSEDFAKWNITNLIKKISCPSLVMQGNKDQYGTLKQVDLIDRHSLSKVKKIIIDDCRHSPHLEKPKLVVDYINEFIQYDLNYND